MNNKIIVAIIILIVCCIILVVWKKFSNKIIYLPTKEIENISTTENKKNNLSTNEVETLIYTTDVGDALMAYYYIDERTNIINLYCDKKGMDISEYKRLHDETFSIYKSNLEKNIEKFAKEKNTDFETLYNVFKEYYKKNVGDYTDDEKLIFCNDNQKHPKSAVDFELEELKEIDSKWYE